MRLSMTQEEFAHALGVSWVTISRWENGHGAPSKFAVKALERIATDG